VTGDGAWASGIGPWLVLAGLGMYHGLNPAMGWLFAVALGLHRQSRAVVLWSLLPIALGHAASTLVVAALVLALGLVLDLALIRLLAGGALIGWGLYHWRYGHRHRVRFGMQTGYLGLGAWSFLMATAHGAGLMLLPALIALCLSGTPTAGLLAGASLPVALAAVAVHGLAMLLVTGAIAIIVHGWLGLEFLRRGWINLDLLWTIALVVTGLILVLS
jgi:hypothetical protein